jgi:hypothetical protein
MDLDSPIVDLYINNCCTKLLIENVNDFKILNNGKVSILFLNIRSLYANYENLLVFLSQFNFRFSIIALCEIKLNESFDRMFKINGYNWKSLYRDRHGGGLRVYFLNDLKITMIEEFTGLKETCEIITLNIVFPSVKINSTLCCIYRPPSSDKRNFVEYFEDVILTGPLSNSNSFLIGDLNMDLNIKSAIHCHFFNLLSSNSFKNCINIPTYVVPYSIEPSSVLDVIAVKTSYKTNAFVIDYTIADHLPIVLFLDVPLKINPTLIKFRNFSIQNKQSFLQDSAAFSNMPLNFDGMNVDVATSKVTDFILNISNKYFPVCSKTLSAKRVNSPWLTKSAIRCIKFNYSLKKLVRNNIIPSRFLILYNKLLAKIIKILRDCYYDSLFNSGKKSSKKTWNAIYKLLDRKKNEEPKQILINGSLNNDSLAIANSFNEHFVNIPSIIHNSLADSNSNYRQLIPVKNKTMFIFPSTPNEVYFIISKLKNNSNITDIPVKVLKLHIKFAECISCLFNFIIDKEQYPESLKTSTVSPLFKSGSHFDQNNYRAISKLPILDKIFQKLLCNRLNSFLTENQILNGGQFGFRKGKSTFSAIEELLSVVFDSINDNEYCIITFADIKKAFDTVIIDLLLHKMNRYGIRGKANNVFSSILINRKQRVVVGGKYSSQLSVYHGVPQGSCLAPILYNLYINDIFFIINRCFCFLYADDTALVCKNKNLLNASECMNNVLGILQDWLLYNKLALNLNKTKYIIISLKPVIYRQLININNFYIEEVQHFKYLGIFINSRLNYNEQMEYINSRLSMFKDISCRLSLSFNFSASVTFYYSHIYSLIIYGIHIWGARLISSDRYKNVINKHKAILRNLFYKFSTPFCCIRCLQKKFNLLDICDIYKIHLATLVYRSFICEVGSVHLRNLINACIRDNVHETRSRDDFKLPYCRVDALKNNYTIMALKIWNTIPKVIRMSNSLKKFKTDYSLFLINNYNCSMDTIV